MLFQKFTALPRWSLFSNFLLLLFLFFLLVPTALSRDKRRSHKPRRKATTVSRQQRLSVLHPVTQKRLSAAMREMKRRGLQPRLTTSFRSRTEQSSLYRCSRKRRCRRQRGIYTAARPGTSMHEAGLAVDVAGVATGNRRGRRLTPKGKKIVRIMRKHGFRWPHGLKDPVHFEIGLQQAGFRSQGAAIKAGQRRWLASTHKSSKKRQGNAGRKRLAKTHSRLQRAVHLRRPTRR